MASLWRILALSWLGGIASPVLTGDMLAGELQGPAVVSACPAATEERLEVSDTAAGELRGDPEAAEEG
jgi:hypothetical protein